MADYAKMLEVGVAAVADACAVCNSVQAALEDVRSITKDARSPVTVADFASQAVIGKRLYDEFGRDTILVEDSAFLREDDHEAHRKATLAAVQDVYPDMTEAELLDAIDVGAGDTKHAGFWTLDPVDGTKGFLRGQQYAIALAYVHHGQPVVGIMGCPNLPRDFNADLTQRDPHGCIYACIRGDGVGEYQADDPSNHLGSIKRLDHEPGQPISVCMSVEKAHSSTSDTDRVLEILRDDGYEIGEPARLDSQAKYAVTARGQADAYLRLPTKKDYVERIWDHAAGSLVASEAGCFVTDIFGKALDFSHGRGLEKNKGVICAPPRLHGKIIAAIEQLGIGRE